MGLRPDFVDYTSVGRHTLTRSKLCTRSAKCRRNQKWSEGGEPREDTELSADLLLNHSPTRTALGPVC